MRGYKLPSGDVTGSQEEYLLQWNTLADGVCDKLGTYVVGFDPGILLGRKDAPGTVDIPVWLAQRILEVER